MLDGTSENVTRLEDATAVESALTAPLAVIYKHSPTCGLSTIAARQVEEFLRDQPDTPVFVVDVLEHRALSADIARKLEVRHESPQVIVLREGGVVWTASHRGVTAEGLAEAV